MTVFGTKRVQDVRMKNGLRFCVFYGGEPSMDVDRQPGHLTKGGTPTMVGGLVAAFFASVCCNGPVVFAALGVGVGATGFLAGTAEFLKAFLPYRPVFIGLTLLLMGLSFYLAYRQPKSVCAEEAGCAARSARGLNRKWLWLIAALALLLVLAPYWLAR